MLSPLHILFLTDFIPSPHANNAGAKMFAYYIRELTRRGHRASFIALGQPHELSLQHDLADLVTTYQAIPILRAWPRRLLRAARRIAQPAEYALIADSGIEQALFQTLQRRPVDIIHALHPWLIWSARRAVSRLNTLPRPAIVGHVMDICAAQAFNRAWTGRRLKDVIETIAFARMARFEFRDYGLADGLLFHSHNDLAVIGLFAPRVPLGVHSPIWFDAIEQIIDSPLVRPEFRLLYVGNSNDPRMRESLDWLLKRVMPRVESAAPSTALHIAGVLPAHKQVWHRPPRVICHGVLSTRELIALYDSARVLVFPLQSGRYSKHVKLLNAFARGLPTVMTHKANFGEQALSEQETLLADEPEQFAQHIVNLLSDDSLFVRIARGGLERIRRQYPSPAVILNSLEQVYALAKAQITQKEYGSSRCLG